MRIITTLALASMLFFFSSCGDAPQPKPPYTIISIGEGDGCCDIYYEDKDGNKGHGCFGYENLKRYKKGDTMKTLPF